MICGLLASVYQLLRMKIIASVLFSLVLLFSLILYFAKYKSAFEADQACHFSEFNTSSDIQTKYGCDHDIETHQWILYIEGIEGKPSQVIKRFRY